ncbi:MAG TPA: TMEM165/GDT1 family protein [Acidimicrobiales bacterium]|nr:TMEM165/GDT1 family protein [Acidimicrobiales bacterium]
MDPAVVVTVFGVIFAAELPDKTMVATLVLSTRFRPFLVWIGVAAAFLVQVGIAVAAGGLLSLAPGRAVALASAALFGVGAWLLLRGGGEDSEEVDVPEVAAPTPWRAIATSFTVLFVSEWGDLSQLATAGFAARFADPVSVFAGSFGALATVAALAVVIGRNLLRVVPETVLRRVAAASLALLAVLALLAAWRG